MKDNLFTKAVTKLKKREGVPIEKGVVVNEEWLVRNENSMRAWVEWCTAYPDLFLDQIVKDGSGFHLFFYQRICLRAMMRYKAVYIVACRAFSKSFLTILALFLQCVFIPRRKVFICAPKKNQGAQIAREKIVEIYDHYPLLKREIIGYELSDTPGNFGKDYCQLKFRNGSVFDVVGALETTRGGRRNGGLIDETRDHDENLINEVVLPLLNVSRRLPDNTVNPSEPNQQVICCTSAGTKTSFAYDRLIDDTENSIINPKDTFVFGCDYRIPVMHGLLDATYVQKLKLSPSYSEKSFAREYLSLWSGGNADSWFNYDKCQRYRKLKNPERKRKNAGNDGIFYLLSVDVGRVHDQSECCIFKNYIRSGRIYSALVNVITLGTTAQRRTFDAQALDLKKIVRAFDPKEVVVDTNGIGVGLADELIKTQIDEDGTEYPPLGFINDKYYLEIQPNDAPKILYGIKANQQSNSQMHANCFARMSSGAVRFLIREQEAKSALLSTKAGQRMTLEQRVERLLPHEMTTRLFQQMANLRLKKGTSSDMIVLERINARFPKDKYSAFMYGLWRIKEHEDEYFRTNKKTQKKEVRQLVFYD